MPLIEPEKKEKLVQVAVRLPQEVTDHLTTYCAFVGSTQAYVVCKALELVFTKDKEYLAWRASGGQVEERSAEPVKRASTKHAKGD